MNEIKHRPQSVLDQARKAKVAAEILRQETTEKKNTFLLTLADLLAKNTENILAGNKKDMVSASDLTNAMKRRLELTAHGIESIANGVREIAKSDDPAGKIVKEWTATNPRNFVRSSSNTDTISWSSNSLDFEKDLIS